VRARLTARSRLTLLFTVTVMVAGLLMAALTYALMRGRPVVRTVQYERRIPGSDIPPPAGDLSDLLDEARSAALSELLTRAAVALVVVTLLAATLGWFVAGRVLRPIRSISATAQRLSAENLSERVPVRGPADELAALAGTVNGMLDRIQRGIAERDRVLASQRMFTANAAHELRTPLTTMRTAIDVTLDGTPSPGELLTMAGDVRTAVEQSQRTLDGLLALARSEGGLRERRPADLAHVAAGVLESATDRAAARDVTLRPALRPAPVSGEPVLLERLVNNLVDNAVRYNVPGGRVAVTTGDADGWACLRVANTGRPLPPDTPEGLLEPFVRGPEAQGEGAGLGLSIVRAIVAAHSGELSVLATPAGGLDVTVRLPSHPGSPSDAAPAPPQSEVLDRTLRVAGR
jgi:signal transduction histidine kinase